jgi:transketolase
MENIRDSFWDTIYEQAKKDANVVIVSADLAAPALDKFRVEMPAQFISVGIAEQNAMAVASGLALKGKRVFVYACSPFIFMRCYEQIKLAVAAPNLPITIVGQGTGLCYAESGVTHHSLEDIGAIRMLPYMKIFTLSDENCAKAVASYCLFQDGPKYVRIDRAMDNPVFPSQEAVETSKGFYQVRKGKNILVVSNGYMLQECMKQLPEDVGIVDLFGIYPEESAFLELLSKYSQIITVEEHTINGGIGSLLCELIVDHGMAIPLKRFGSRSLNGYHFKYGGRDNLEQLYGVGFEEIKAFIQQRMV